MRFPFSIFFAFAVLVLASCSGYNKGMQQYSQLVQGAKYSRAFTQLDNMDALKHQRNRFLYLAEKGRLYRLTGQYDSSNIYLNEADNVLEDTYKKAVQQIASNLINPLTETYLAVDYERFMLHYYKALNYLQLQDKEAAVVEARRITLQANRLADKKMLEADGPAPFAYTLQGIIYEQAGQINDAFVSYRNAVDLQLAANANATNNRMAGMGLLSTAVQLGFTSDYDRYSGLLKYTLPNKNTAAGTVIVLHDVGWAPLKENRVFSFNSWLPGNNDLLFTDRYNQYRLPVAATSFSSQINLQPWWFMGIRVAMAVPQPVSNSHWVATASNQTFEKLQDLNTLAARPSLIKQELIKSVVRALAKKAVEIGAQESARAIAKSTNNNNDSKQSGDEKKKAEEKRKKDEQAAAIAQGVGLLVNLVNQVTEKADTRTWSSLPAAVYGVRIPLQAGDTQITISANGITKTLPVQATNGLQVIYW